MNPDRSAHRLWLCWAIVCLGLGYLALYFVADQLKFDPTRDEKHYWRTTKQFAKEFPPSIELLRGYNELNTPLPFVVFGGVEHFTNCGISAGRLVNLLVSFSIVMLMIIDGWRRQPASSRHYIQVALACAGLLAFPYFLGTSVMLYTDILPAAFVLAGLMLHLRGWPWLAMIAFALAISCRQYAVAFPLGLAFYELGKTFLRPKRVPENHLSPPRDVPAGVNEPAAKFSLWLAPGIAALSLLGWIVFFGGLAPRAAVEDQSLSTAHALRVFPAHSLYFLTCIGAYYVVPELILFRRIKPLVSELRRPRTWALGGAVIVAFLVWPPLRNVDYGVPTMGYLDKAVRLVLGDVARMSLFGALALLTVIRFNAVSVATALVWINALLMMKAHIGWDKYAMPLLVALWWMKATEVGNGDQTTSRPPLMEITPTKENAAVTHTFPNC